MIERTYSLQEVVTAWGLGGESNDRTIRWLADLIRAGRIPARKIGRSWRMTESDVVVALDAVKNKLKPAEAPPEAPVRRGPSARSLRRRV
ncbi:hypothetical protein CSX11_24185 [Mycobacterium goodii]|nr:hypothetical protein CSX11_24185 [Mycolicibacterium goodii]